MHWLAHVLAIIGALLRRPVVLLRKRNRWHMARPAPRPGEGGERLYDPSKDRTS